MVSVEAGENLTEDGVNGSFTINFSQVSPTPVTVNFTLDGSTASLNDYGLDFEASTNIESVDFNAADNAGSFTVAANSDSATLVLVAEDDANVELQENIVLNLEAGNGYSLDTNNDSAQLTIVDNDIAGVSIIESNGSTQVSEAGTSDTYQIVLTAQPEENVTVTIESDNQLGFGFGSTAIVTFTPDNWDTPQFVTVNAVDDNSVEEDHNATITHTVTSDDPNFNGLNVSDVSVSITDNDFFVSVEAGENLTEDGDNGSFTINFSQVSPTPVTVNFTLDGSTASLNDYGLDFEASTNIESVNFNVANNAGSFTVAANSDSATLVLVAEDDVRVDAQESIILNLEAGNGYSLDTNNDSAQLTIIDNDIAGVSIIESDDGIEVSEDGVSDTYEVVLTAQPEENVTVTINSGNQLEVNSTSTTTLNFTPNNWDNPQFVTVEAVDDNLVEGDHNANISHTLTSGDPNFNGTNIANVNVSIIDNDPVVGIEAGFNLTEDGANGSFNINLGQIPPEPVTVNFGLGGSAVNFSDYRFDPIASTNIEGINFDLVNETGSFTIAANSQSATLVLVAEDDVAVESQESILLTLETGDGYSLDEDNIFAAITITDNDPLVSITPNFGNNLTEESLVSNSFTISLNSESPDPLTLDFDFFGTASLGSDYNITAGTGAQFNPNDETITLDANIREAVVRINPVDDDNVEPSESIGIVLSDGAGYSLDISNSSAQFTLEDNDSQTPNPIPPSSDDPAVGENSDVVDLTGFANQEVQLLFVALGSSSDFDNIGGFYQVDNAQGEVDGLLPGESGYAAAALAQSNIVGTFDEEGIINFSSTGTDIVSITGGGYIAPFVLSDGNSDSPIFAFEDANAGGVERSVRLGGNVFAFEDTLEGGDGDLNDIIFGVNFDVIG